MSCLFLINICFYSTIQRINRGTRLEFPPPSAVEETFSVRVRDWGWGGSGAKVGHRQLEAFVITVQGSQQSRSDPQARQPGFMIKSFCEPNAQSSFGSLPS